MTQKIRLTAFMLVALLWVVGCSELPKALPPEQEADSVRLHQIFVINHGWHTGVIVAAEPLLRESAELRQRFPKTQYLEFGWGDQGFYQAEEVTTLLAVQALFWPTPSVVHVASLWAGPSYVFPSAPYRSLCLSEQGFQSLQRFLLSSVAPDAQQAWQPLGEGLYGDSQFYRGVGQYHLFHTCNNWTAKALQSAGLPLSASLKLTARSVMGSLEDLPEAFSCRTDAL